MIKQAGFTKKRTTIKAIKSETEANKNLRKEKAIIFSEYLKRGFEFIFIDESSFNQSHVPLTGYAKKGKPFYLKAFPKGINITLIAAITRN